MKRENVQGGRPACILAPTCKQKGDGVKAVQKKKEENSAKARAGKTVKNLHGRGPRFVHSPTPPLAHASKSRPRMIAESRSDGFQQGDRVYVWQHDNVQWLRWAGNVTECNDADTCTVVFDGGEEALIQRSCIHNIDTDSEPPRPREGAPSIVKLEEDAPRPVGKRDRILSLESIVDLVLAGAHPRLRECCDRDRIISVLEAEGAFDADAVCLLLDKRFEATMGLVGSAAPTTFLLSLHKHASGESTNPTVSEEITRESIALSTAAGSMLAAEFYKCGTVR